MGMGVGGPSGGRDSYRPLSEINVTPLVDVMLVLLIIFMVAAPLMTVGVPVDLPKTTAEPVKPPKDPVVVTIDKAGTLFLLEQEVPSDQLEARLQLLAQEDPSRIAYVRADRELDYGKVIDLMGRIGQSGFSKVSLMAEMPPGAGAPAAAAGGTAP